jgi:hypothetical protein
METYKVVGVEPLFKEGRTGADSKKRAKVIQEHLNAQIGDGWVYRDSISHTITEGFSAGYTESFLILQRVPQQGYY